MKLLEYRTISDPLKIVSKGKFDFISKLCKSGPESFNPEWSQQKAGRDEPTPEHPKGRINSAGGGGPSGRSGGRPNITRQQACAALQTFLRAGGLRRDLPDFANPPNSTPDAGRNRGRRPDVERNKKLGDAKRPDGWATLATRAARADDPDAKPQRMRYGPDDGTDAGTSIGGGWKAYSPEEQEAAKQRKLAARAQQAQATKRSKPRGGRPLNNSVEYLSKSINENFSETLDDVLGL